MKWLQGAEQAKKAQRFYLLQNKSNAKDIWSIWYMSDILGLFHHGSYINLSQAALLLALTWVRRDELSGKQNPFLIAWF